MITHPYTASIIVNTRYIRADTRSCLAFDNIDNIGERTNHRVFTAIAGKIDGSLHFWPHRTAGKTDLFNGIGMRAGNRFLRIFTPIDKGS